MKHVFIIALFLTGCTNAGGCGQGVAGGLLDLALNPISAVGTAFDQAIKCGAAAGATPIDKTADE